MYCAPNLSICLAVKRVNGAVRLRYGAFSGPKAYKLCVKPPTGSLDKECKRFRLKATKGVLFSDVRWTAHFSSFGKGTYTVTWSRNGKRIGKPLTFKVGKS